MSAPSPPAVVLGGSYNAVSVVRSLSRSEITVTAVGLPQSAVRYSRHCARFVELGSGARVQERWCEWLANGPRGAVILPCDDDGLELIARHRAELLEWGYRPFEANDEVVRAMLDKDRTYEIARRIGVPAPRTATVRNAASIGAALAEIGVPCALKPVHSHEFAHRFGRSLKAIEANDRATLEEHLARFVSLGIEMLVTEVIPGPEDSFYGYYTYLDEMGEPLFQLTKRKLRQYPPAFGMGCYHVTGWHPDVAETGLRFLQGAGARGLANVELKRDASTGELKLIECNHRFTAINELLRIAGADLALFAYARLAGRPPPPIKELRPGMRLWHPAKDARSAWRLGRRGQLTFGGYVRSIAHRQHTPMFEFRDPGPSVGSAARQGLRVIRRALRRRA